MSLVVNMATQFSSHSMESSFKIYPNVVKNILSTSSNCCHYSSFKLQEARNRSWIHSILHESVEKNPQWSKVGQSRWPTFWTLSSNPWIFKHSLKMKMGGRCNVRRSLILLKKQNSVVNAEHMTERKCPSFDNSQLFWLLQYQSIMDLPHHCGAQKYSMIFFALYLL